MPVRSSKKPKGASSKGKGATTKKPRGATIKKPRGVSTEKPKGAFSKRLRDVGQLARSILDQVIGHGQMLPPPPTAPSLPSRKNPAAVSLGRLGGLKGGKARAAKLTSKKRTAIAKKAATARWGGAKR